MTELTVADFTRRDLPPGGLDEHAADFIPRPMRAYFQTVTVTAPPADPAAAFDAVLDALAVWMADDLARSGRPLGWGYRR